MRDKKEFIGMNKSSIVSQLKSFKDSIVHGPPHYKMTDLVDENKISWAFKNLMHLGNTHYKPYPPYKSSNGIFKIQKADNDKVDIALLSDWASDTPESHMVSRHAGTNDYSIHLGDTYYVGNEKEIGYNFNRDKGNWPYGTLGSFAMLGNHEMYSSGKSYFKTLLPWMGAYTDGQKPSQAQESAYFCLENKYWRIVGLDTGYYSLKGLLGTSPNLGLDLHEDQIAWLKNTVQFDSDKRGIVILSHHQCFSAFEDEFPKTAKTIAELLGDGRSVIWLWGHEHWSSVYGPNKMQNGGNVYARCIGNSGMPVELYKNGIPKTPREIKADDKKNRNLVLYDNRKREDLQGGIALGFNGFVRLTLESENLTISYYDDNHLKPDPRKILEEEWSVDLDTGGLKGKRIEDYTIEPNALCQFGTLSDAIK